MKRSKKEIAVPVKPENSKGEVLTKRETQELNMVLSQIGNQQSLTEKQVNTILRQRDKAMDYQHKDTQKVLDIEADTPKNNQKVLMILGTIVLLLFIVVGVFDKQYIGSLINVLLGFVGGSGAGYVYAKKDKTEKE